MAYTDHFRLADDMINHLNTVVGGVVDPFIQSRYVGFVSVSAVTVYELAIKEILCTFASQKHKVFGDFAASSFERLNGRIKLETLKGEHIKRFGAKYVDRFQKKLEEAEKETLKSTGKSIKSSYDNIIQWRHQFAHQGQIPPFVTYNEVIESYSYGKMVIDCLFQTMRR